MANVYSTLLMAWRAVSAGTNTYTVPAGFRAVVRDIVATPMAGSVGSGLFGFDVHDHDGHIFFARLTPAAFVGGTFHWEGRQIVDAGGQIIASAYDDGWDFRISGYLLTLP